jgi:hypothetical protein
MNNHSLIHRTAAPKRRPSRQPSVDTGLPVSLKNLLTNGVPQGSKPFIQ